MITPAAASQLLFAPPSRRPSGEQEARWPFKRPTAYLYGFRLSAGIQRTSHAVMQMHRCTARPVDRACPPARHMPPMWWATAVVPLPPARRPRTRRGTCRRERLTFIRPRTAKEVTFWVSASRPHSVSTSFRLCLDVVGFASIHMCWDELE